MPVSIYAIYDRERLGRRLDHVRVVFFRVVFWGALCTHLL